MSNKAFFNEYGTAYRIVWPGFHNILIPAAFVLDAAQKAAEIARPEGRAVNIQHGRVFIGVTLFAQEIADEEAAAVLGDDSSAERKNGEP